MDAWVASTIVINGIGVIPTESHLHDQKRCGLNPFCEFISMSFLSACILESSPAYHSSTSNLHQIAAGSTRPAAASILILVGHVSKGSRDVLYVCARW